MLQDVYYKTAGWTPHASLSAYNRIHDMLVSMSMLLVTESEAGLHDGKS